MQQCVCKEKGKDPSNKILRKRERKERKSIDYL